jgi:predicted nucleic acid-binding protein
MRLMPRQFITTDYVLLELADAFHKPSLRTEFLILWELLHHEPVFQIVSGNKNLLQRGVQFYKKRADKEWQLTDCISFLVMADLGIKEALTGDRHFAQAGFKPLLA